MNMAPHMGYVWDHMNYVWAHMAHRWPKHEPSMGHICVRMWAYYIWAIYWRRYSPYMSMSVGPYGPHMGHSWPIYGQYTYI